MSKNIFFKIIIVVLSVFFFLNLLSIFFLEDITDNIVENIRLSYMLDFWNSFNFGFLNSKFFFFFVLVFPLLVSLGYLVIYMSIKFFGSKYNNFSFIKEITIFFGFLYFFLFILILIDFVYYIEVHKLYFNVNSDELELLLKKSKN
jgi:hypothetical protein